MEEDILKIIEENRLKIVEWDGSTSVSFIHPDHYPKLAKEITSRMMGFIEWFDSIDNPFHRTMPETKPVEYVNLFEGSKRKYFLEEIYQYWSKNVKK